MRCALISQAVLTEKDMSRKVLCENTKKASACTRTDYDIGFIVELLNYSSPTQHS